MKWDRTLLIIIFWSALAFSIVGPVNAAPWDPVAIGSASPNPVTVGQPVTFSDSASYIPDPYKSSYHIIEYRWFFDVNPISLPMLNGLFSNYQWYNVTLGGYSADGQAFHATNSDDAVYTYDRPGTHIAALEVINSDNPPGTNIVAITDIEVTPAVSVPEPLTLLFLGPVLLGATGLGRKFNA